jgi:hypothetical protein
MPESQLLFQMAQRSERALTVKAMDGIACSIRYLT